MVIFYVCLLVSVRESVRKRQYVLDIYVYIPNYIHQNSNCFRVYIS